MGGDVAQSYLAFFAKPLDSEAFLRLWNPDGSI